MVKYKQMLFTDFKEMGEITEKVKSGNEKRIFTGGVRIGKGMYRTYSQMEKYREHSLQRKLP